MPPLPRLALLHCACALLLAATPARADEFEAIDGPALSRAIADPGSSKHEKLGAPAIAALPRLLRDARSGLVLVKTDQGNVCALLVSFAKRGIPGGDRAMMKKEGGSSAATPVMVLERIATFEPEGKRGKRLALARDLVVFDGFRVDLDAAQVVPDGQGGDIRFDAKSQSLEAIGPAVLWTPARRPESAGGSDENPRPTPGRKVVPSDFSGRYRLSADGRTAGILSLKVDEHGVVGGQLRSDSTGTAYNVEGSVSKEVPNRVDFTVILPQAHEEFEGYLFTNGKGVLAGKATLQDRPYGFYATREP
jgi:hypothetical protein